MSCQVGLQCYLADEDITPLQHEGCHPADGYKVHGVNNNYCMLKQEQTDVVAVLMFSALFVSFSGQQHVDTSSKVVNSSS